MLSWSLNRWRKNPSRTITKNHRSSSRAKRSRKLSEIKIFQPLVRSRSEPIKRIKSFKALIITPSWEIMKTGLIITRFKAMFLEKIEWWQKKNSEWRKISTTRFLRTLPIRNLASQTKMPSTTGESSQLTLRSAQSTTDLMRTSTWNSTKRSWSSFKRKNKSGILVGRTTITPKYLTTTLRKTFHPGVVNTRSSKSPKTRSRW